MPTSSPINYRLPQVDVILQYPELQPFITQLSRPVVVNCVRETLQQLRQSNTFKRQGIEGINVSDLVLTSCQYRLRQRQTRVINATGTVIHTNLGRSPLSPQLWDAVREVNTGYNNLEIALSNGKRGERKGLLSSLLSVFAGSEAGMVVNNNAASVYLLLLELAKGKEVIVSRGEQIQIGGGFRIPDILALSGAKLVEVGTTNVTTADDYLNAINENTAMVLMVHQSNFAIRGFTESPDIHEVVKGLPEHVLLAVDQGSGLSSETLSQEETPLNRYLQAGADLVCFSGDKIIGGPQAGIICGKASVIDRLEKNPMMRAFRPSRIILSLLEELLVQRLNQCPQAQGIAQRTVNNLPVIEARTKQLAELFPHYCIMTPLQLIVGGGSLPDTFYPSWGVTLVISLPAQQVCDALRDLSTPIIATLRNNAVILNVATVLDEDWPILLAQLSTYFSQFNQE